MVGDKWGMNIWLRERARQVGPSAAVAARIIVPDDRDAIPRHNNSDDRDAISRHNNSGQLVRVTLTTRPVTNPVSASDSNSNGGSNRTVGHGLSPCPACGELVGPLGLCLCKSNYVAPPASDK